MGILPLVMTLLMILGVFSLAQFREMRSPEAKCYVAYFNTSRNVRNAFVDRIYRRDSERARERGRRLKGVRNVGKFAEDRGVYVGSLEGRCNLLPLLRDPLRDSFFKEIVKGYMRALYGHVPDYRDALLDDLLQEQEAHITRFGKPSPLSHCFLENSAKHALYYRFLRGTHLYRLQGEGDTPLGIPPLAEFFAFEVRRVKPMRFSAAPELFLRSLFPSEFIAWIDGEYRRGDMAGAMENWIEKGEEWGIANVRAKLELFDFSSVRKRKQIREVDVETGISMSAFPPSECPE